MKVLARNYRCPAGEADLIALDASTQRDFGVETLCFIEVKTRSSDRYVDPASAVGSAKQKRLRRVANYYLATHDAADLNVRFDVVSILKRRGERPDVEYIADAF
jgi:putative endonuclease